MLKVSVIIPTYNSVEYICEAVDSALAQTYQDFEIIVIDDGSSDDTHQILSQYGNKIKYIYQGNRGVSAARNRGIHEAQGEYVAFLDADDGWYPDKLKGQVSIAEQNPEIDLFFSDWEAFNVRGLLRASFRPSLVADFEAGSFRHEIAGATLNDGSIFKGNFYNDLIMGNVITTCSVLVRKGCLEKVGYFDESLSISEDYDLWMRISRAHILLYFNSVNTRIRFRDDSSSGEENLRGFFFRMYDAVVLEKQLRECPKSHKDLIKKRILECYKTAVWGHYNLQDFEKVRTLCLRSLRLDKFQMKLYLYLFAAFFPAGLIKSRTRLGS
jgi:glycosyltransferase involved in cell wall biosynthesis